MKGEDRSRQPTARNLQAQQNIPQQQGRGGVEQDIEEMIAPHRFPPKFVADPKSRIDQRMILLRWLRADP